MLVTTVIFSSTLTSAAFFDRLKGRRVLTGRTGAERGVIQRFRALEAGFMRVVMVVQPRSPAASLELYLKLSQQHRVTLQVQNSWTSLWHRSTLYHFIILGKLCFKYHLIPTMFYWFLFSLRFNRKMMISGHHPS